MPLWSYLDLSAYSAVIVCSIAISLTPLAAAFVVARLLTYLVARLPIKIIREFHTWSLESRQPFQLRSNLFEFWTVEVVKWCISHFNAETMGPLLFGELITMFLYDFRRFRFGTECLGDNCREDITANVEGIDGYWVRSASRADQVYDLVVYFVPGKILGFASAYVYQEFCSLLLVSLQSEGFKNPAVFVLDVNYRAIGYEKSLQEVEKGWRHISYNYPDSTKIVMGSSLGATLLLSQMLINPGDSPVPHCAILISPIWELGAHSDVRHDLLSIQSAQKLLKWIDPQGTVVWPWQLIAEAGSHGMPQQGIYISSGKSELLNHDISELTASLKRLTTVCVDEEENQVHAWPIVMAFIGRNGIDQMFGIDKLATRIAHMALIEALSH